DMRSFLLLGVLATCCLPVWAKKQNITVKGVTMCDNRPMENVHVELYEHDILDPNDLLSETHTNSSGEFSVFGEEDEMGTIEPFVRLTHDCKVSKPGCQRIGDYIVPKDKIDGVYDMSRVALDVVVQGEKEKC
ncbi:Transthyretin-like family protein, partial [Teladorsagia circumcincta]